MKFFHIKDVYLQTMADDAGEIEVERVLRGNKKITFKTPTAVQKYDSDMGFDLNTTLEFT